MRLNFSLKSKINKFGSWIKEIFESGAIFFVAAIVVVFFVFFDPQVKQITYVQNTMFVVDISESMNVRDVDYPRPKTDRLSLAKETVSKTMASLPCGSLVSLGLFAGDETTILFEPLEVCRHYPAINQVVMEIDHRMRWVGDSKITNALASAINEAKKRDQHLIFITDGDEMPHKTSPRITELLNSKNKVKGLILGVGGDTPQPIPHLNQKNQVTGYWTREEAVLQGNHPNLLAYVQDKAEQADQTQKPDGLFDEVGEHLSALNNKSLEIIASASGLNFLRVQNPKDAVNAYQDQHYKKQALADKDARWMLALVAIGLILIGWFWSVIRTWLAELLLKFSKNQTHPE